MKIVRGYAGPIVIFSMLIGLAFLGGMAQTVKLKKVRVYFGDFNNESGGDELKPLPREVEGKAPLKPTIEDLLAGPTAEEEGRGFAGVSYGELKLASIKFKNGTARIDFTRSVSSDADYNPGDLLTLRFKEVVTRTAEQFPGVKKVVVCVNGQDEFGIGMVIDAPVPCPKDK